MFVFGPFALSPFALLPYPPLFSCICFRQFMFAVGKYKLENQNVKDQRRISDLVKHLK